MQSNELKQQSDYNLVELYDVTLLILSEIEI